MAAIHCIAGTQGAGKSTYASRLAEEINAVVLSIDEWMWSLFSADLPETPDVVWLMERIKRCEDRIWLVALAIVERGGKVILDLGFMKSGNRTDFMQRALAKGIPMQWHYVDAPYATRLQRVMHRNDNKDGGYAFQVTPEMFHFMEIHFEPPDASEAADAVLFDND